LPEQFFPLLCELHWQHSYLPSIIASPDFDAQRSSYDLVPKADANQADSILLEQLLYKVH
jgi:hypothetical protein